MPEPRNLATIAAEVVAEGDLPADPAEALDYVSQQLALERPDTTTRGRQVAAAKALGVDAPPTGAEADRLLEESRPGARLRGLARRGRGKGRGRRRGRGGRRPLRVRVAPASTLGGVFAQALGLVALYWAIRSARTVAGLIDGVRGAVEWVIAPEGWSSGMLSAKAPPRSGGGTGGGGAYPV